MIPPETLAHAEQIAADIAADMEALAPSMLLQTTERPFRDRAATLRALISEAKAAGELAEAVELACDLFTSYADQHMAKAPPALLKAATNREAADRMSRALARYKESQT